MCNKKKNVPESIGVADLGCSSGPNTLMVVSKIIDIIDETSRKTGISFPELRISLNDLPGNDFNDIFRSLPAFFNKVKQEKGAENCYVVGVPGSFYGRLFPKKSMHFVHSSSSLHWLSQVSVTNLYVILLISIGQITWHYYLLSDWLSHVSMTLILSC